MRDARGVSVGLRTEVVGRGTPVVIEVDGREVMAYEGESVLGVLWAEDIHTFHVTARRHEPRGFFCGIGVCFDCLVNIDDRSNVRACMEPVRRGLRVRTQADAGYRRCSDVVDKNASD